MIINSIARLTISILTACLALIAVNRTSLAEQYYSGFCDGSAAIALGNNHMIVADDEGSKLRLYPVNHNRTTQETIKPINFKGQMLAKSLKLNGNAPELDIEGATRVGRILYWITSHARNRNGKLKPDRYRLIATKLSGTPPDIKLRIIGQYTRLAADLGNPTSWIIPERAQNKDTWNLIARINNSIRLNQPKISNLAPKKHGFNIEALSLDPHNKRLLIGLRNPLSPKGNALILPLNNSKNLIKHKDLQAEFAAPIELDLDGLGIRGMEFDPQTQQYFIIAGPTDQKNNFKLYRWNGKNRSKPKVIKNLQSGKNKSPEAVLVYQDSPYVHILNDQGNSRIGGKACKHPDTNSGKKKFSDQWVKKQ